MNSLKAFQRINTCKFVNASILDHRVQESPNNRLLLTCEHASNLLPQGREWSVSDQEHFQHTHWSYDIGAQDMAVALSKQLECTLVVSKYSRLFCDVNRVISSETLCRKQGDGKLIELNQDLSEEEEDLRLTYFESYLRALRMLQQKIDPEVVISVHSFTDMYEGQKREVEVGVLFSHSSCLPMAEHFQERFSKEGFNAGLNVPWDGMDQITQAVDQICKPNDQRKKVLLIELRNDLLSQPAQFARLQNILAEAILSFSASL